MTDRNDDHLDPYELYGLQEGSLSAGREAAARSHLERCGRCRAELTLARDFATTPHSTADLDPAVGQRLRSRVVAKDHHPRQRPRRIAGLRLRMGLLAASIVVAALGIAQLLPTSRIGGGVDSSLRGGGSHEENAWSPVVESAADESRSVSWPAQPRALRYQIVVLSISGEVLWETEATQTSVSLSDSVLAPLRAKSPTLFLGIRAAREGGAEDASRIVELRPGS